MHPSEHKIQTDSIKFLKSMGFIVLRLNAGTFHGKSGFVASGVPAGTPDLEVILKDNQSCFIEFKDYKGKPSPKQVEWHQNAMKRNLIHGLSRSVQDTVEIVTKRLVGFGWEKYNDK